MSNYVSKDNNRVIDRGTSINYNCYHNDAPFLVNSYFLFLGHYASQVKHALIFLSAVLVNKKCTTYESVCLCETSSHVNTIRLKLKTNRKSDIIMIRTENGSATTSLLPDCCNMNDFSQTYQISWQTRHHNSSKTYTQCYKND